MSLNNKKIARLSTVFNHFYAHRKIIKVQLENYVTLFKLFFFGYKKSDIIFLNAVFLAVVLINLIITANEVPILYEMIHIHSLMYIFKVYSFYMS